MKRDLRRFSSVPTSSSFLPMKRQDWTTSARSINSKWRSFDHKNANDQISRHTWRPNFCYIILDSNRGFVTSRNVLENWQTRITSVRQTNGVVHALSLFPNGGFFIRDSQGIAYAGAPPTLVAEFEECGEWGMFSACTCSSNTARCYCVVTPLRLVASALYCNTRCKPITNGNRSIVSNELLKFGNLMVL